VGDVAGVTRRLVAYWIGATVALGLAGPAHARNSAALPAVVPATSEIVTFGDGTGRSVTVIRGSSKPVPPPPAPAPVAAARRGVETVTFTDPGLAPVTVIRGAVPARAEIGLFRPASGGELDRVAFAVEGVESGHGTNLRMWRPEFGGPQGPMQVSAAAALDVGGGDRFDLDANRQLGKAFLARMYERYGNWPDALAGYNWGPGNVDSWIAAGRPEERLPLETARYIEMVLRDAVIGKVRRL
jgi:hypothetical protein